jgi:alkylated DNA nucleotide flippase Atl1
MAQVKLTFEDPENPGQPGCVRLYGDISVVICTDHGDRQVTAVQPGWKIRRDEREPWMTVLTAELE